MVQGKKYKDIANELATTPDAVRMQKTRAIKLLQQKLLFVLLIASVFI
jgi:DNA-binding NarL/FixJ family response regulator